MQNENNSNNKNPLTLFIIGVLLVGALSFWFFKSFGTKEPDYQSPDKNLAKGLEEVKETPQEQKSDEDLAKEALEAQNSGKEVKGMSDQKVTEQPVQPGKMTVEQKLAVKAPEMVIDAAKTYTATLKTSMGDIVITLDAKNRPQTVNNFVYLSKMSFYDDVIFHRIIPNFMIQGGDPLGTGTGGPSYKFADELTAPNTNAKGTISMANAGPNTNGSQFFINLVDNNYLDGKHSVFGKVTQGMDVVEALGKVKTGASDRPVTSVFIQSVTITEE